MMLEKICLLKLKMKVHVLDIIKKTLNLRFYSQPIYDNKYIKTKVKTFNGVVNTPFSDNKIPK